MSNDARRAFYWRAAAGAAIVLITRLLALPRTPWESDEFQFIAAVLDFDPSKYHPHPPGYPLFVGLGKLAHLFIGDPFAALVTVSVLSTVIGFVALAAAFRQYLDDPDLAVTGALLFYLSAGMLVHSELALADGATLMFLALAFYAMSRFPDAPTERRALAVGLWCAAAVGVRPQICIPLLPAFAAALWLMRSNRLRAIAVATFGFVCLMWFLPLMDAAGGWQGLVAYEVKQAQYFAEHDAAQSRGALGIGSLAARFVLHPWGSKYVTIPLLACIALGLRGFLRRFRAPLLPLAVFTAIHLGFALAAMDPADGVRYALPSTIFFALIAACGFDVLRRIAQITFAPWLAAAFFAAVSWWYVWPIVKARTQGPSPVAAAAQFANARYDPRTVILYDLSLRFQTEYLMPRFRSAAVDKAGASYVDDPSTPVVLFADGGSHSPEAKVFAWPPSDAYGKLSRNHYLQVTLDPIRIEERFAPVSGVYALERTVDGAEWRWLKKEATLRLPRQHRTSAILTFRLSHDAPYATNPIRILV
ncbi:MAG: hypothetical protein JWO56_1421, partial [Acidobacteria bacterium]|nr:hypothetical protein [Acidobacteriota bacterium]